jgi:hypothetical protein
MTESIRLGDFWSDFGALAATASDNGDSPSFDLSFGPPHHSGQSIRRYREFSMPAPAAKAAKAWGRHALRQALKLENRADRCPGT